MASQIKADRMAEVRFGPQSFANPLICETLLEQIRHIGSRVDLSRGRHVACYAHLIPCTGEASLDDKGAAKKSK